MSAAANAAGYLYASGRLHGKHKEEQDERNRHEQERLRKEATQQSSIAKVTAGLSKERLGRGEAVVSRRTSSGEINRSNTPKSVKVTYKKRRLG